jgi:chromosome segregation ATPase
MKRVLVKDLQAEIGKLKDERYHDLKDLASVAKDLDDANRKIVIWCHIKERRDAEEEEDKATIASLISEAEILNNEWSHDVDTLTKVSKELGAADDKNKVLDKQLLQALADRTAARLDNVSLKSQVSELESEVDRIADDAINLKIERTSLIKKLEAVESIFDSIAHSTNTGLQVTEL